jgi:phage N-6-adenine-methyltransferase
MSDQPPVPPAQVKSEEPNQSGPTISPTAPSKAVPVASAGEMRDGSETPQWLFDVLNRQVEEITGHGFQLDAAASGWNAKCGDYYDEEDDALRQDWSGFPSIWCNPPFSADLIGRFVAKAVEAAEKGSTVVLLLPSWPGYDWYQELKRRGQMRDVIGPVSFDHHDGGRAVLNKGRNSVSLVVALLGPHVAAGSNGPPISRAGELNLPSENSLVSAGTNGPPISRGGEPEPPSEPRQPDKAPRSLVKKPKLITLSELTPVATDWLWPLRIPKGELTILDGDPSVNKSSLLMDLAARVSTGREMPDGTGGVLGGVLLLLAEDSLQKAVLQRLTAAGADLDRIAVPPTSVVLPRDMARVEEWVSQMRAALVIIDPLIAFLACDPNSDRHVRLAMTPLRAFAERSGCAVVLVRHLTKRGGRHALYRGGGSIGIGAATRSALMVGRPPDDPDLRVLRQTKSNLGPLAPSLLFEPVATPEGVVRVEWRGECDSTPDDLLVPAKPGEGRLAEAIDSLKTKLSGGPAEQQVVKDKAIRAELAYRTVERARERLGVRSDRQGWGPGSKCYWRMPTEGP